MPGASAAKRRRRVLVELRSEWPRTDDVAIAHRRIVTVTFVDVNAEILALLREYGLAPSEEPPY